MLAPIPEAYTRTFDFSGVASRIEFWTCWSLFAAFWLVFGYLGSQLESSRQVAAMSIVVPGILQLPLFALCVRRLHDVALRGWWIFLGAVPLFGPIVLLVIALFPSRSSAADWPFRRVHLLGRLALLAVVVVFVSRLFWAPYWMPTGNMKPNLLIGDYFAVYTGAKAPDYGDVVVFRHPVIGQDFIIRVVGLPGDTVQMRSALGAQMFQEMCRRGSEVPLRR